MYKRQAQWILEHSKIKFLDSFMVQGFEFELMSLSKENIAAAKLMTSSDDVIKLAANGGIAINKKRMIEDDSLVGSLKAYWEHEEVTVIKDPTIMFSVGEKVCELSGLSDVLAQLILDEEEKLAKKEADEEEAYIIDGDNLNHEEIQAQADEYHQNQNII